METSANNRVIPNSEVTPDLVAQKDPTHGVVCEAKAGMSQLEAAKSKGLDQLRKYDDDIRGWWTENGQIGHSDAVLLVHQSRSRPMVRWLEDKLSKDPGFVSEDVALIEFNRSDQANVYVFFRLEWGSVADPELRERLKDGVSIPLEKLLRNFISLQFYDTCPPIPLLMAQLWTDFLASRFDPESFNKDTMSYPVETSVQEITEELQKAYGSGQVPMDARSCEFPKQEWVRSALDAFVSVKLACKLEKGYRVFFKQINGDVFERFVRLLEKQKDGSSGTSKSASKDQLALFGEE